jgi:DnaJ-class molecular chaperone
MSPKLEPILCFRCKAKPGETELPCGPCKGTGQVSYIGVYQPQPCKTCKGSGRLLYCRPCAAIVKSGGMS